MKTLGEMTDKEFNDLLQGMKDKTALKQVARNNYNGTFKDVLTHEYKQVGQIHLYAICNTLKTSNRCKRYNLIAIKGDDVFLNSSNIIDLSSNYGTIQDAEQVLKNFVKRLNESLKQL